MCKNNNIYLAIFKLVVQYFINFRKVCIVDMYITSYKASTHCQDAVIEKTIRII